MGRGLEGLVRRGAGPGRGLGGAWAGLLFQAPAAGLPSFPEPCYLLPVSIGAGRGGFPALCGSPLRRDPKVRMELS